LGSIFILTFLFPGGFNWPIWVAQDEGYFGMAGGLGLSLQSLITDRGFDNKTNVKWLQERVPVCESSIACACSVADSSSLSVQMPSFARRHAASRLIGNEALFSNRARSCPADHPQLIA
jgi:hypothetical protein